MPMRMGRLNYEDNLAVFTGVSDTTKHLKKHSHSVPTVSFAWSTWMERRELISFFIEGIKDT